MPQMSPKRARAKPDYSLRVFLASRELTDDSFRCTAGTHGGFIAGTWERRRGVQRLKFAHSAAFIVTCRITQSPTQAYWSLIAFREKRDQTIVKVMNEG